MSTCTSGCDSDSDFSVGSESSFRKANSSSTSRRRTILWRQKVEVITIDYSDFDFSEDELGPSGMGLMEKLKKRGGRLKTTRIGLTGDDDTYNVEEEKNNGCETYSIGINGVGLLLSWFGLES